MDFRRDQGRWTSSPVAPSSPARHRTRDHVPVDSRNPSSFPWVTASLRILFCSLKLPLPVGYPNGCWWHVLHSIIPKSEDASTVGQMRPITIFELLFRVRCGPKSWPDVCFSPGVIFYLQQWLLDFHVDLMFTLLFASCHCGWKDIRLHIITSIGGYVFDITKCLNAFPRAPSIFSYLFSKGFSWSASNGGLEASLPRHPDHPVILGTWCQTYRPTNLYGESVI